MAKLDEGGANYEDLVEPVLKALDGIMPFSEDVHGALVLLHGDFKVSNLHWADSDELLVLDWEFAYSGHALMDVGQLFRWSALTSSTSKRVKWPISKNLSDLKTTG